MTASLDGLAMIWDLATGQAPQTLPHDISLLQVAVSPDGTRIATATQDGTARLWDPDTSRQELTLYGHDAPVFGVAFSPDGRLLAVRGRRGRLGCRGVCLRRRGDRLSDDGGLTWVPRNDGVTAVSTPEDAPRPEVGYCVHGLAHDPDNPDRIWRQDHTGVYRTTDGGDSWERIETGLPAGFGFVIWRDQGSGRLFTVPLEADENRVPVGGRLRAYRSDDDGDSWQEAGTGWGEAPQFTGVLRNAFDGDGQGTLCFGTTGGKLWLTGDNGESWEELPPAFPRVLAVRVLP